MNDQFPDATKMVPDGYYFANVWDDSGRVQRELVRVAGGKLYNESGKVLFPAAVSDFKPATTADLCALWPWTAASELTTLRAAVRALHAELQGGRFAAIPVGDILGGKVTL
jgi:hypothetical protein